MLCMDRLFEREVNYKGVTIYNMKIEIAGSFISAKTVAYL